MTVELSRTSLAVVPCVAQERVTTLRVGAGLFCSLLNVGLNGPPLTGLYETDLPDRVRRKVIKPPDDSDPYVDPGPPPYDDEPP